MDEDRGLQEASQMKPGTKEEYVKPELTVHGTVQELTQAIGLKGADGITGSNTL